MNFRPQAFRFYSFERLPPAFNMSLLSFDRFMVAVRLCVVSMLDEQVEFLLTILHILAFFSHDWVSQQEKLCLILHRAEQYNKFHSYYARIWILIQWNGLVQFQRKNSGIQFLIRCLCNGDLILLQSTQLLDIVASVFHTHILPSTIVVPWALAQQM